PHTGRGGWSWYTGSAGWMYRLVLESLLGLRLETTPDGALLHIEPCLPADWKGFSVTYRFRDTTYALRISQGDGGVTQTQVVVDGHARDGAAVPLVNDGRPHEAVVRIASRAVVPET